MKKILKFCVFYLFIGLFILPINVFAISENIAQLNFVSNEQSIDQEVLSSIFTIQTQNAENASEQISETTSISLSSTSSTGIFYNANASECTTELNSPFSLTLANGSANKRFCYKDITPGVYTITVSAEGKEWIVATQNITVNSTEEEVIEEEDLEEVFSTKDFSISLQSDCAVQDINNELYTFPKVDSLSEYLAVCALFQSKEDNEISGFELTNSEFGLYVSNIDGISPSETEYWAIWLNDSFAECGIECLPLSEGDILSFVLTDWMNETESTRINITIENLVEKSVEENNVKDFNITLGDNCTVQDVDSESHTFPKVDSPSNYLAVCALYSAKENEQISGYELVNSEFGLYLKSLDDVIPSATEYWALWLNDIYENRGITSIPLSEGDILSFVLTDWMNETESTRVNFSILIEENNTENNNGSGGGGSQVLTFSVPNAISYLQGVQGTDGSFGSSVLYSDWVAIAYGSYNVSGGSKSSLLSYIKNNNSISSLLTDNERRAMAILALGENPYSFNGVNYIEAIINKFDGNQFGDESLVNDDIFALIPLKKSGYGTSDEIISKSLDFIISKQKSNGSWENSIDITAAGIQALSMYKNYSGVNSAIENAKTYLKNSQVSDGGFGSVYASAWASQAMSAVSENWTNGGKSINDYFASQQINDGAVLPATDTLSNRIWSTSYAVPAVLGKSWSDILVSVNKPSEGNLLNDAVNNDDISNEEVLILNTEIDEKEVSRLVSEIKNMIAQEEARTKNTKAIANNINTNEAQNDTKEKIKDLVSEVELQSLSANAAESKKKIPVAVVITSAGVLVIAGFFVRRFIF